MYQTNQEYQTLADLLKAIQHCVYPKDHKPNQCMEMETFESRVDEIRKRYDEYISTLRRGAITAPAYWDCNCTENYVHPNSTKHCIACDYASDDIVADSHLIEVLSLLAQTNLEEV